MGAVVASLATTISRGDEARSTAPQELVRPSESGRRWQNHLWEQLRKLGGQESPAYPSTWVFGKGSQTLVLNIYVDDLTLSGPVELHAPFWHKLRSLVKLDPEVFVKAGSEGCRILGRHHSVARNDAVATCEFDMVAYTQQLVDFYCEISTVRSPGLTSKSSVKFPVLLFRKARPRTRS